MGLKDIAEEDISEAGDRRRKKIETLNAEAATLQAEIDAYVTPRRERIAAIREQVKKTDHTLDFLERALFARTAVEGEVGELRDQVKRLQRESAKKSITVGKADKLRRQLSETRDALQKRCKHPFVIRTDGYDGRLDPDDMGYSGQAGCVLCGLTAYDKDHSNNNEVMPDDGTRLVRRMIHEVGYHREGGTDKKFEPRLREYAALATADEVAATYFGEGRLKNLSDLLEADAQRTL